MDFNKRLPGLQRAQQPRVLDAAGTALRMQGHQAAAIGGQQGHLVVDGVLRHVVGQALLHGGGVHRRFGSGGGVGIGFGSAFGRTHIRRQERPQRTVCSEKPHIRRALKQIAHEDVDRHLRPPLQLLHRIVELTTGQAVQQAAGQRFEGAAGVGHVGRGAAHLTQQGQAVPSALQAHQRFAIFIQQRHG